MQTVLFLDVLIEKICASGVFFQARRKSMVVKFMFAVDCVDRRRTKVGCGNGNSLCKSLSFFRLPKEGKRRGPFRKKWLARIPRKNTPLKSNSYVCVVHFPEGAPE